VLAKNLAAMTDNKLPTLAGMDAVTIQVVNLWYPQEDLHKPYYGFGYLIPGTVPADQNPECALGVMFDSSRENMYVPIDAAADVSAGNATMDSLPGTKVTVLLGGHYWSDLPQSFLPDSTTAIESAKAVLERHLGIPRSTFAVTSSKLCVNAIPQHRVGHLKRLSEVRSELEAAFDGHLAVVGSSYQSPGVLPSIRAAREIAHDIAGLALEGALRIKSLDSIQPDTTLPVVPVGPTGLGRTASIWSRWPNLLLRQQIAQWDWGGLVGKGDKKKS
jgi:oxygen-dependent protoporphyrinogen oxidase